jgi:hypothetical protein
VQGIEVTGVVLQRFGAKAFSLIEAAASKLLESVPE